MKLLISDVMYVPDLRLNLLSCSKLAEPGVSRIFDKNVSMLIDKSENDDVLAKAYMKDSLYWLTTATSKIPTERANIAKHSDNVLITKWHNRIAHLVKKNIS